MLKPFKLPELAEGVDVAVVIALLAKTGDQVAADQIVAELENDKATAELPVPFAGVVREVYKKVGDEIRVGEPLLSIEVDGSGDGASAPETEPAGRSSEDAEPKGDPTPDKSVATGSTPTTPEPDGVGARPSSAAQPTLSATSGTSPRSEMILPAGPEVRRLARELGVDLHEVTGTGPRDRITPEDVRAYTRSRLQSAPPRGQGEEPPDVAVPVPRLPDFTRWGEVEARPMMGVRRKTAEVVAHSWREIPHVVQHDRADITDLSALRKTWEQRAGEDGVKVTVTAVLLKAVAAALKVFPRFNCSVDMGSHQLIYKRYIHLAVAVDAGHGLLTPVIRNADRLGVLAIAEALATLSAKARDKKLSLDEMAGSTFAVSNLGGLGTTAFAPIVTWPHVAVLGVGKGEMQPVWTGDEFVPRRMLPLALSYDHRANDGADAARFLRWIAEALEDPMKILMEAG